MDDIPPHRLNQFRLFMQMQQSYEASAPASTATSLTPHVSGPAQPTTASIPTAQCNALNSVTPNQPPITSSQPAGRNPPITPYQSARQLSSTSAQNSRLFPSAAINGTGVGSLFINGHRDSGLPAVIPTPPQGMGPTTGLGTSFLGFQQRTGQANQARLAAAGHNLPRRPVLQKSSSSPQCSLGSQLKPGIICIDPVTSQSSHSWAIRISNVGGALWALHDAVRRGTLTFALWDAAQRCTVLYSFPQRDSVGPKIRNC